MVLFDAAAFVAHKYLVRIDFQFDSTSSSSTTTNLFRIVFFSSVVFNDDWCLATILQRYKSLWLLKQHAFESKEHLNQKK